MSGRRHSDLGGMMGGRVPADRRLVRRLVQAGGVVAGVPPMPAGVPLIGAEPHQVRLQCITSDGLQPTVIELAAAFAGLLAKVGNWAEPIENIKSGRERQAMAFGDGPTTIAVLRALDHARTRILEINQDVQARTAVTRTDEPEPQGQSEPAVDPEPAQAATEDRTPLTREALAARLGIPEPETAT